MRIQRFLLPVIATAFASTVLPESANAQCRMSSGPDHGDGIPYCEQLPPPAPTQPAHLPVHPPSWNSLAAAVVWADSDKGDQFIGISKYFDEKAATDRLMQQCRGKAGWRNCAIALSVTNGVIAVGRDSYGRLRVRRSETRQEAQDGLLAKCRDAGMQCTIEAIFDGMPGYF